METSIPMFQIRNPVEPKLVRFLPETCWFPASSSTHHPLGRLPSLPKAAAASASGMAALPGLQAPEQVARWTSSQVQPKRSLSLWGDVLCRQPPTTVVG